MISRLFRQIFPYGKSVIQSTPVYVSPSVQESGKTMVTKIRDSQKAEELSVPTVNRLIVLMLSLYALAVLSYSVYWLLTP